MQINMCIFLCTLCLMEQWSTGAREMSVFILPNKVCFKVEYAGIHEISHISVDGVCNHVIISIPGNIYIWVIY